MHSLGITNNFELYIYISNNSKLLYRTFIYDIEYFVIELIDHTFNICCKIYLINIVNNIY